MVYREETLVARDGRPVTEGAAEWLRWWIKEVSEGGRLVREGRPASMGAVLVSRREIGAAGAGGGLAPAGLFTRLLRRSARYEAVYRSAF